MDFFRSTVNKTRSSSPANSGRGSRKMSKGNSNVEGGNANSPTASSRAMFQRTVKPGLQAGFLKAKKKFRINFLAPKWHLKYYVFDDNLQQLRQYPDKNVDFETAVPEIALPYSEIESVAEQEHYFDRCHTMFDIVIKETASVMPPGSVWSFEAHDEQSCKVWVEEILKRTCSDHMVLAREDIKGDFRRFYEVIHSNDEVLGTGMTGTVKKVKRRKDGKAVAMKTIRLSHVSPSQRRALQNEIDILKTMDHPHISRLYEVFVEPGRCVRLMMEICEGGELFDRLHEKRRFPEHYTAGLMSKMLSVLNYLHRNQIVHRDLKLENWLFRNKGVDDLEIVLIDFGLSKHYHTGEHMHKTVGTSYYVAPEVLAGDYSGEACDMWSLGVIAFMLMGGTAPFDGADDDEIIANVKRHRAPNMSTRAWQKVSDSGKHFVLQLLQVDINKRMTAAQALNHPWITMEEASRPKCEVDLETVQSFRKFTFCKGLKRIAMEVVAFTLDHKEIKALSDMFEDLDSDKDGYITINELRDALSAHNISEEEIGRIFYAMDEEHTGLVHVNEFVAAALQENFFQQEERLADAFSSLDRSNCGYITAEDLRKVVGNSFSLEEIETMLGEVAPSHKVSYQDFLEMMRTDGLNQVNEFRSSKQLGPVVGIGAMHSRQPSSSAKFPGDTELKP